MNLQRGVSPAIEGLQSRPRRRADSRRSLHDDEQFPPPRRPPTSTETSYGCPATSPSQPGPDRRTKSPVGRKSSHGGLLLLSFSVLQSRAGNGASVSDGTRRRGRGASALYPRSDPRPLHGGRESTASLAESARRDRQAVEDEPDMRTPRTREREGGASAGERDWAEGPMMSAREGIRGRGGATYDARARPVSARLGARVG